MKVKEIAKIIESHAPLSLAYAWDNPGLLVGSGEHEVKRAYITLDVNLFTVREAVEQKADIIISHHPIFFDPIKKIDYSTPDGEMIRLLVQNDIAVYAAHTNLDTAPDGINTVLADLLGIKDTEIIEHHTEHQDAGLGRVGTLENTVTLSQFAERVKAALNTPHVRVSGDLNHVITCAAVGSGSCADIIPQARQMGAEAIVTGDMKYHSAIDSVLSGIAVIDAGHYPTEVMAIKIFEDFLKDTDLEFIESTNPDIFQYV